jgi:hypothetical protein
MDILAPPAAKAEANGRRLSWRRLMGMSVSCPASLSRILNSHPMIPTLDQIVSRVDDPETPVVWLDPAIPDGLWAALPGSLRAHGFEVFHIDSDNEVTDRDALMARFDELAPIPGQTIRDFESLRNCLLRMATGQPRGWAILFSNPDPLRQSDEAAFEELMEALEMVHESLFEIHAKSFKFVVRD